MSDAAILLHAIEAALAGGSRLIVLTDFDGTLAPLACEPGAVRLATATRGALATLAGSPRIRVGIVSGRALADVRGRVGLDAVTCAGCHGLDVDGPDLRWTHPRALALRDALAEAVDFLRHDLGTTPGVLVEDKGLAVALHYRTAPPDAEARVEQAAAAARKRQPGLAILRGTQAIELVPDVGWNKGECALWLRDAWGRDASIPVATLCLGDDETDESAFRALAGKAWTVRVGSARASAAGYHLDDPADVARLLAALAARTGGES